MRRELISYERGKQAFVSLPESADDLRMMCESDDAFVLLLQQYIRMSYRERLRVLEQTEDIEPNRVYSLRVDHTTGRSASLSTYLV